MIPFALKYWRYLAVALLLLAVYAWHRGAVREARADERRIVEEAQALVIAKRTLENEKREHELALFVAQKQVELEGKNRENELLTVDLNAVIARKRVCFSDEVRRSAVPEDPKSATGGDGRTQGQDAPQNVGEALVGIVSECQRSVDKLVTLQSWVRAL